jgi:hypothetical protein
VEFFGGLDSVAIRAWCSFELRSLKNPRADTTANRIPVIHLSWLTVSAVGSLKDSLPHSGMPLGTAPERAQLNAGRVVK